MRPVASHLEVGACSVDTARRIVAHRGDARETRLTIKALQVLLVLVEQQGQVVSRGALFERVWPDTMPTDDVLTQAIAQLRKAFGDDRDAPSYVETIAKGGYRLVADCRWLPDAPADPASPLPPSSPTGRDGGVDAASPARPARGRNAWQRTALPVLVLLALGAVVAGVLGMRQQGGAAPASAVPMETGAREEVAVHYRAITSSKVQERWPSLSPDGTVVVYSQALEDGSGARLMTQAALHEAARVLTSPPRGSMDHMPVWSRNGTMVAFVRTGADGCALMTIAAGGGDERRIGDCLQRSYSLFDWTPDGKGLVMGGLRDAADSRSPLRVLDLASGQWRALDYPLADNDIDFFPRYSPDGKWLAFRRNTSLSDLWMMPAGGGMPRRLTELKGDIRGWDWLPDGSGIVLSFIRGEARLYVYTLADGTLRPLPALADENAVFPDVASDSWAMVFEIDQMRSGIFRMPMRGARPAGNLEQVFASSGIDMLPSISPHGSTIAFISDRTMHAQLWVGDPAQPGTLRAIEGVVPVPRHPPVWSPEGDRLLVVGRAAEGDQLFEIDVGSDDVRRLPLPPGAIPVYGAYTRDPRRMLVGVDGGQGRLRLRLHQLPSWEEVAAIDDVAVARYDDVHDQVYFTRPSRHGLWRVDAGLGTPMLVADGVPHPQDYRNWTLFAGRPYYSGSRRACETSWVPLPAGPGDGAGTGDCIAGDRAAIAGSPTVDRAGRWLVLGLPLDQNIDVGWSSLTPLRAAMAGQRAPERRETPE